MNGRKFLLSLGEKPTEERDEAILQAVLDGHAAEPTFEPVALEARGHTAVVMAARRALVLGEEDPVLIMVRQTTATRIADHYGTVLGTARLSDALWLQADAQLAVFLQTPDAEMAHTSRMIEHSDHVLGALKNVADDCLAAPMGKDWHATNKLRGRPDRCAEYGAQAQGAPHQGVTPGVHVWQPAPGTAHSVYFSDYMTGAVRLYRREVVVDGSRKLDIEDLARDPELCWLVSSEGVLVDGLRHPAVPRPGEDEHSRATAPTTPPPAPVFSRTLRQGMTGDDVRAWQRVIGCADDGIFGPRTHDATEAWQRSRGLVADGIVGPRTRAAALKEVDAGHHVEPPTDEYLGELDVTAARLVLAKHFTWADRKIVHWLVLHSMEWAEKPTTAEACAAMFAERWAPMPTPASAHVCFDCDSVVCCVPEEHVAWHARRANKFGVGYEHAGFARQSRAEWLDSYSESMLWLSARHAGLVTIPRWKLPVQFVDRTKLKRAYSDYIDRGLAVPDELRGITTHVEVTYGLGGSHVDPGKHFPTDRYLAMVQDAMEA